MQETSLRHDIEKIRDALAHISKKINDIYSDNTEDNEKLKDLLLELNTENYKSSSLVGSDRVQAVEKTLYKIELLLFKNVSIQETAYKIFKGDQS